MAETARDQRRYAAPEMKIRDAGQADLPAIVDIYNAAIATRLSTAQLEPVTLESRRRWLTEHSPEQYPFWVLEFEGRVVGWLTFKAFQTRAAYRGTAELSVYVHPDLRRRGVARRLMSEAIERAPAMKLSALIGLIFAHNDASLKLFEQFGFERWGLLPRIANLDGIERDLAILGRHV